MIRTSIHFKDLKYPYKIKYVLIIAMPKYKSQECSAVHVSRKKDQNEKAEKNKEEFDINNQVCHEIIIFYLSSKSLFGQDLKMKLYLSDE